MEKKKIIHFVSGLISGGVEQMLYNYISKMDSEEFDTYVVYQHEPDAICYEKLNSVCKEMIRISSKKKHPFKNMRDSRKIIKYIKPDVVHCHMNKGNFFALLPAKKENVKVRINHSHTAIVKVNFIKKIFFKLCDRINSRTATHHMACGEEAAKFICMPKSDKRPVYILLNKIDDTKFLYNEKYRKDIRENLKIGEADKLVATIGRLEAVKNHIRLIEIFKCIKEKKTNYKLLIIGSGSMRDETINKIRDCNLENSVIIIDSVKDIYRYYSAFDCFVLPSLYEGLPLVSVEAQFNEVPIILSDTVAKSAKLTEYVDYISLNENNELWANEIIRKVESGRNSKDTTQLYDKYSLNKEKNDLEEYYNSMIL